MKIEVSTLVGCFGQAVRKNGDSQVQGHHRLLFFPSSSAEQWSPPVPLLLLRHHRYHRHHCLSRRQCFQYSHSLRPRLPSSTSHLPSSTSLFLFSPFHSNIYVARITPVTYQLRSYLGPVSTMGVKGEFWSSIDLPASLKIQLACIWIQCHFIRFFVHVFLSYLFCVKNHSYNIYFLLLRRIIYSINIFSCFFIVFRILK